MTDCLLHNGIYSSCRKRESEIKDQAKPVEVGSRDQRSLEGLRDHRRDRRGRRLARLEGGSHQADTRYGRQRGYRLAAGSIEEVLHLDLLFEVSSGRDRSTLATSIVQTRIQAGNFSRIVRRRGRSLPHCCQLPEIGREFVEDVTRGSDVTLVIHRSLHSRLQECVEVEVFLQLLSGRNLTLRTRRRLDYGRQKTRSHYEEKSDA
ncbi:hypothetical protein PFISCL1PPCAC_5640 [Pristionchus fissidentatus]|uniref:Ribosomal protein n=1 Tax=Pristionchus fissidentatus TaxID=1538716 RepID=A0AAV5V5C6_9BILA|nr:hypothetical protein PFISCL1PPCAC_5640 [Pristionchus fissidentatus]